LLRAKRSSKKKLFDTIAVLGLGLIGGSIALDVKKRRLAKRVVGYNRSAARRRLAKRLGACDEVTGDPREAVKNADVVILAVPVRTAVSLAKKISPALAPRTLVTDVGSTKKSLVSKLSKIFKAPVHYVGSHPIAGTEHSGMESALTGLFQGRWWLLTPHSKTPASRRALRKFEAFARALGAKTAVMSPERHDEILAAVSHLPHMVAFSLVDAVLGLSQNRFLQFAGGSFRDFTRIAASSPQIWSEICVDNRNALLPMIRRFERSLKKVQGLIAKQDLRGLNKFFTATSRVRRKI
jgi:cyclohexadieny/prephenate dehydrogenase